MKQTSDLINLDINYYKNENSDLVELNDEELQKHYFAHGYFEGRANSKSAYRENFVEKFQTGRSLEIGPFANPTLKHVGVDYFDVITTEQMKVRAQEIGISGSDIPEIKYVSPIGDISIIEEKFDTVFSCHNIEHQPDIIAHFNQVSDLLNNDGQYALIVPDCRYCFDAELPISKISEVINAFYERRSRHTIGSVIEHRALTTHNDALRHWQNSQSNFYRPIQTVQIRDAIDEFESSAGSYIDVHAWQFHPLTFSDILTTLIELEMVKFSKVNCNGPVFGRNEFTVTIQK